MKNLMHHILFYKVVDDYLNRRAEYRTKHLELARNAFERGDLILGGALADPVDSVVIVFKSAEAAEAFAKQDPYVENGLVTSWRVRKWVTVVGEGSSPP